MSNPTKVPVLKQQARPRHQQQQGREPEDFSPEYLHRPVEVWLVNNAKVIGSITGASRYWFKVLVNGETIYINKAHVIYVKPLQQR